MKRFLLIAFLILAIGFLIRYGLVLYYTFYDLDPWGLERYLAMRGLRGASIQSDWNLCFSRCHDPSGLLGEFPVFTSIRGRCDEFDVLNVKDCKDLMILDVGPSGMLKHLESLAGSSVFQVSGAVDSPIHDISLLDTIRKSNWRIVLQPNTNSIHDVCRCLSPEVYDELVVDVDVFSLATREEVDCLRGLPFSAINSCRTDYFWEMLDDGVFFDVRKGKLAVPNLIE